MRRCFTRLVSFRVLWLELVLAIGLGFYRDVNKARSFKAKSLKAKVKAKSLKAKAKARSLKAKTKAKAKARDQG